VATWDDFPNGRFGDYSSPAFGIQGPWGGPNISVRLRYVDTACATVTHIFNTQRTEAFTQYGHPTMAEDLTEIFLRYLHLDLTATPFSPTPLSTESHMILRHLERLTSKGWWTVGSQPAVDGVSSSDKVVGWGPLDGYVYQKAFVEFFAVRRDVESILKKIDTKGNGWIHYFAGNYKVSNVNGFLFRVLKTSVQGEFRSNVTREVKNPVTWGVFPGQEIACSTIIERESFFSWKVGTIYPPQDQCHNEYISNRTKHSRYGQTGRLLSGVILKKEKCSKACAMSDGW
jgi:methylenetetrahydrofolate reductase (NADPH)